MDRTGLTTPPSFTGVVNREFFIEPLGGPKNPQSYLSNFPESIFTHDINSNLVALLYTLLGPAGVGRIRQQYLLARLTVEGFGLNTINLDELYANPFGFARLIEESYEFIPQGLLTASQWEEIQKSDASYRNRAIDFLKAVRAGGTLQGVTLAAKSGLNRPVEVVENYKLLFDHFSDHPLGLPYLGATESTEEVIVIPHQDVPKSSVQTITISGAPNAGAFTINLPIGSTANTTTVEIAYNAIALDVQKALEKLPVVGPNNVRVSGGPAPNNPFVVSFTGTLADQSLPIMIVVPQPSMVNAESELAVIKVNVNQVGVSADGEESSIAAQDWYYTNLAIEQIKPVTTILTPIKGKGLVKRQTTNLTYADSTFTQVIRYVTGLNSVRWPEIDTTHWIEPGREKEAPVPQHAQQQHYVNFHNVKAVSAYTDAALEDPTYELETWPSKLPTYQSEKIGPFSIYERTLFSFLEGVAENFRFGAEYVLANPPDPLTIQATAEEQGFVGSIYPVDYQSLDGVNKVPTVAHYWASQERLSGADYLEIDLGTPQAVNYLSMQVVNKPLDFDISYDVLDESPARRFIPITFSDTVAPQTTSVGYTIGASNPWKTAQISFVNSLGRPIFTRFLRIGFTRRTDSTNPFILGDGTPVPFSVEVKNLRVGRNLS